MRLPRLSRNWGDSPIQGNGEAGRVSGDSALAAHLTFGGTGRTADSSIHFPFLALQALREVRPYRYRSFPELR